MDYNLAKITAWILVKLSHIFPKYVHAVVDTETLHYPFYFKFFGLKILKGQLD